VQIGHTIGVAMLARAHKVKRAAPTGSHSAVTADLMPTTRESVCLLIGY